MEMDAKQFERDVTLAIYRLHKELREHNVVRKNSQLETVADDFNCLLAVTQKMLQSFQCWKENVCSLSTRQSSVDPLRVDNTNCNGTTSNDRLETRDKHGSILLLGPKNDTTKALKRLEWHLLVCWFTCEKKFETTLSDLINSLLSQLEKQSNGNNLLNGKTQIIQVIKSLLNDTENMSTINWSSIHQLFNNLLNDLLTQNNPVLMHLVEIVASADRAVVSYQSFHDQWIHYKQMLEANYKQKIEFLRDSKLFGKLGNTSRHRCQRFYELKLTAVQTVMREETTYTKLQPSASAAAATVAARTTSTSVEDGERYQSIASEQLTSVSHEEDTVMREETTYTKLQPSASAAAATVAARTTSTSVDGGERYQSIASEQLTSVSHEEDTVMREETTYTKLQPSASAAAATVAARTTSTSVDGGERYQSIASEQLTSVSHEEDTVMREETTYTKLQPSASAAAATVAARTTSTSVDGGERYQSIASEQLTSVSHEEDTVMREETTYTKLQPSASVAAATVAARTTSTSINTHSGERYQSVAAEQLTSMSHEESTKFVVKSVVDPRDGSEISIEQAVKDGIIDHQSGRYVDLVTGQSWPIATAMNEGRIHVEKVLTTRTEPTTQSLGLITIRTQTDTREYVITGARDTTTGKLLLADEARQQGIVDETEGTFLDTSTGQKLPLGDAVDAGLVDAQFDEEQSSTPCETKTYAISAVVDQILRRPVPFPDAVRNGLIDRLTGSYVNNVTGEKLFAAEAIRRGLFKYTVVDGTSTLNVADIDSSHQVVVDRIDRVRKNVLRSINVLSALKQQAECT